MNRLTSEEKYFISCFIENCNQLLLPSLGKTISLYTFLDGTSESKEDQNRQIEFDDPFLSQVLFDISYMVDDERFYKRKMKELKKRGYSESPHFMKAIRVVSEWLWLVESDEVRKHVRKDFSSKSEEIQRKKNSFNWPRSVRGTESRKNITPEKNGKSLPDTHEDYDKLFDFELIEEKIRANLLTSSQILQILDQSSSLGLSADQIDFLKLEYGNALTALKKRHEKIYIIDEKGSVNFKKRRLVSDFESLEKFKGSLTNNPKRSNYPFPFSYIAHIPKKQSTAASTPAKPTIIKNPSSKKIFLRSFFCSRCETPFEAQLDKQNILCPCCGGKINI